MMTPRFACSRSRFCRMAGLAPFAAAAIATSAKASVAASPDADYEAGTGLLKSGRNYLQAIAALERAAQAKPENAAYQSALGCAYAARFASVCDALRQGEYLGSWYGVYKRRKQKWDKAQTDANYVGYHSPPPVPPDLPATPDDDVPLISVNGEPALVKLAMPGFNLANLGYQSVQKVKDELLRLRQKSLAAFDAAHRLAFALPLSYQAAVQYERGWGLFFLWREDRAQDVLNASSLSKTPPPPQKTMISTDAIVEAFRVCVRADEKNAAYWHSLALALVPRCVEARSTTFNLNYWRELPLYPDETRAVSLAAFERALTLKPDDFDLLYQSGLVASQGSQSVAAERFEQAAHQNNNAVLWYFTATMYFQQAEKLMEKYPKILMGRTRLPNYFQTAGERHFEPTPDFVVANELRDKAITIVERGSRTARYEPLMLALPVPPVLRAAWAMHPTEGWVDDASILYALRGFIEEYIGRHRMRNTPTLPRGITTMLSLGRKVVQSVRSHINAAHDAKPRHLLTYEEQGALSGRVSTADSMFTTARGFLEDAQAAHSDEAKSHLRDLTATEKWAKSVADAIWE